MKMTYWFLAFVLFLSCSDKKNDYTYTGTPTGETYTIWDIPLEEVFDGGPGKDGIPALESPNFVSIADAESYMQDDDLVIGVKMGSEIRGYTHPVLDWHEIVNDEFGMDKFAMTYCPLTGTGIRWNRVLDGEETTFGVSGLLYNTNLIPYDRKTDGSWAQMQNKCVNGPFRGDEIETMPVIEMNWSTWKEMFPFSQVLSTNTGHDRNYGSYPYGDYKTNHSKLVFPISPDDARLDRKERVLGVIIGGEAKVYRFKSFDDPELNIVTDEFQGENLVIAGSSERNFMVVYSSELGGTILSFSAADNSNDNGALLQDNEGNEWNIFGEAVSGPREGQNLKTYNSYMGYWLAWGSFYPNVDIY
jgi:hypothetical protein